MKPYARLCGVGAALGSIVAMSTLCLSTTGHATVGLSVIKKKAENFSDKFQAKYFPENRSYPVLLRKRQKVTELGAATGVVPLKTERKNERKNDSWGRTFAIGNHPVSVMNLQEQGDPMFRSVLFYGSLPLLPASILDNIHLITLNLEANPGNKPVIVAGEGVLQISTGYYGERPTMDTVANDIFEAVVEHQRRRNPNETPKISVADHGRNALELESSDFHVYTGLARPLIGVGMPEPKMKVTKGKTVELKADDLTIDLSGQKLEIGSAVKGHVYELSSAHPRSVSSRVNVVDLNEPYSDRASKMVVAALRKLPLDISDRISTVAIDYKDGSSGFGSALNKGVFEVRAKWFKDWNMSRRTDWYGIEADDSASKVAEFLYEQVLEQNPDLKKEYN